MFLADNPAKWIQVTLLGVATVVACVAAICFFIAHIQEKSTTTAVTAPKKAATTPQPRSLKARTSDILKFFIATMKDEGNPGLRKANFRVRGVEPERIYIPRGENCWQVRVSLPDNPWTQCVITPEGNWLLIGHLPPPFDFDDVINGPTSDVIQEWFDALYDCCVRTLEAHLPDRVDELKEAAAEIKKGD